MAKDPSVTNQDVEGLGPKMENLFPSLPQEKVFTDESVDVLELIRSASCVSSEPEGKLN